MPKPDKQCESCGRSVPEQEIHPPLHIVQAELTQIRKEMASASWDERRAHIQELSRALVRDPQFDRISRLTSVAVFTAKQLHIAERMISAVRSENRTIGD